MPGVEVRPEPLDSPVARRLIAELNAELSLDYPPAQRFHSLDAEEVAEGAGAFVVLWLDGEPAGCGAVRLLPGDGIPPEAIPGGAIPGGAIPGGAIPGGAIPGGAIRAERSRAERSRAERSRAERSRAERSRAERSRAERSRAERSQAKRSQAKRSQAKRSRAKRWPSSSACTWSQRPGAAASPERS